MGSWLHRTNLLAPLVSHNSVGPRAPLRETHMSESALVILCFHSLKRIYSILVIEIQSSIFSFSALIILYILSSIPTTSYRTHISELFFILFTTPPHDPPSHFSLFLSLHASPTSSNSALTAAPASSWPQRPPSLELATAAAPEARGPRARHRPLELAAAGPGAPAPDA